METIEQQNALKDAMARAKEIAAKLKQSAPPAEQTENNYDYGKSLSFGLWSKYPQIFPDIPPQFLTMEFW